MANCNWQLKTKRKSCHRQSDRRWWWQGADEQVRNGNETHTQNERTHSTHTFKQVPSTLVPCLPLWRPSRHQLESAGSNYAVHITQKTLLSPTSIHSHTGFLSLSLSPLIYQHTASGLKRGEPANGRTATPSVVALFQRETGFFFLLSPFWQVKALGELSFSFSSSRQTSQHAPPVLCLALCCVHRPGKWTLWARWRKREEGGLFFSLFTTVFFSLVMGWEGVERFLSPSLLLLHCVQHNGEDRGGNTLRTTLLTQTHTQ